MVLKLREAQLKDCEVLFSWANDPLVRDMSLSREKIVYKNHVDWYLGKLESECCCIYIASFEGRDVGQIRFDSEDGKVFEIDIHIIKKYRGKGFAVSVIKQGISEITKNYQSAEFKAIIKYENSASCNSFLKAGFSKAKEVMVKNYLCGIYYLKI